MHRRGPFLDKCSGGEWQRRGMEEGRLTKMASFLGYRLRRWDEEVRGSRGDIKWGRKTPRKAHSSANHILGLELRSPL